MMECCIAEAKKLHLVPLADTTGYSDPNQGHGYDPFSSELYNVFRIDPHRIQAPHTFPK
jgi:hypothetical protein